jgi:hypothetical protein
VPDALSRVRPALVSFVRRGALPPSIADLTPKARRILRVYAAVTGPALVAVLAVVAMNVPALVDRAAQATASAGGTLRVPGRPGTSSGR